MFSNQMIAKKTINIISRLEISLCPLSSINLGSSNSNSTSAVTSKTFLPFKYCSDLKFPFPFENSQSLIQASSRKSMLAELISRGCLYTNQLTDSLQGGVVSDPL